MVLLGEEFNQQGDLKSVTLTGYRSIITGHSEGRGMLKLKAMS